MNNTFKLTIAIIVSELAGIMGLVFTTPSIAGWYANLAKPELAPPNWIFGPAWTTLFALMGIAAFLVWKKGLDRKDVRIALGIFIGQLMLNTLWSIIFFGLHSPGAPSLRSSSFGLPFLPRSSLLPKFQHRPLGSWRRTSHGSALPHI